MRTDLEHFSALWCRLGAGGDASAAHSRLVAAYSEPTRAYHSLQHLEECLVLFDQAKATGGIARPDAVEMALWLHDAVYDPKAADNEEQSAALARELLTEAGVADDVIGEVEHLVLVTKTHFAHPGDDSAWMADIDLAILGQPSARFQEYEAQIWQEYSWVPRPVYLEKRAEVLRRFLDRERLFVTPMFHERLETSARTNLARALS